MAVEVAVFEFSDAENEEHDHGLVDFAKQRELGHGVGDWAH